MTKAENKVIWITGASSGLGRELAFAYANPGIHLILSGRNIQNLNETGNVSKQKGADITVLPFDLCSEPEINTAVQKVCNEIGKVDLLINNSGIGQRSLAMETTADVEKQIFQANFFGHVFLTKQIIPLMVRQGSGNIAVISSLSGLYGFPLRSLYSAAKHALNGYFETLAIELKPFNISVTIVCPGRLQNSFSQNALKSDGTLYGKTDKAHEKGYPLQKATQKIQKAIAKKQYLLTFGRKELLLWYIKRISPSIFYKLACKINPES
jgi:dehydrogenase/reductase SDR family member 7B